MVGRVWSWCSNLSGGLEGLFAKHSFSNLFFLVITFFFNWMLKLNSFLFNSIKKRINIFDIWKLLEIKEIFSHFSFDIWKYWVLFSLPLESKLFITKLNYSSKLDQVIFLFFIFYCLLQRLCSVPGIRGSHIISCIQAVLLFIIFFFTTRYFFQKTNKNKYRKAELLSHQFFFLLGKITYIILSTVHVHFP